MMSAVQEPTAQTTVRKLEPTVALPTASVLKSLGEFDEDLLKRRLAEQAECVFDPSFESPNAEQEMLAPLPSGPNSSASDGGEGACDDSGFDLLSIPSGRALTTEQERCLFMRLNYVRYRVMCVLEEFAGNRLSAAGARELVRWERQAQMIREEVVRLNMPLVLAMAKRTKITGADYAELISEGNLALLRSVDKFDCNRGFKFSTYACRAILKSFSRVATRTARYRGYFPTEFDPTFEKSDFVDEKRRRVEEDCVDELRAILGRNLARLNHTEERVIRARFNLDGPNLGPIDDTAKGKTLEQVGEMIGVTKERVRQIQNKALEKLRQILQQGVLAT